MQINHKPKTALKISPFIVAPHDPVDDHQRRDQNQPACRFAQDWFEDLVHSRTSM
jgi:hypothetical protein